MTRAEWIRSGWSGVEQEPQQQSRKRPESGAPLLAGMLLSCSVSTGLWLFLGLGWTFLR